MSLFLCLILQLLLLPLLTQGQVRPSFTDVAAASGIQQPRSLKFGGPLVADIDNDGHYDLILSFHNKQRPLLFWGSASGKFTEDPFTTRYLDIHGINVGQITARSRSRIIAVNVGGGLGSFLKVPEMYIVHPNRTIVDITKSLGFGKVHNRGRVAVFMDLALNLRSAKTKFHGGPDIMFTSFLGLGATRLRQYSYENRKGKYRVRGCGEFSQQPRGLVEVTDIDGDGIMEVISIRKLLIYKLTAPFTLSHVTYDFRTSLPFGPLTVTAVVEFDFDNDGDMDLYVTTANRPLFSPRKSLRNDPHNDLLLENQNGFYVDATRGRGIPKGTNSLGVTAGDFNNDGNVDLLVVQHRKRDIILLNKGDGTFTRVNGAIPKASDTIGNHAVAVDYNLDGRLDAIVGHGGHERPRGNFLLMKNSLWLGPKSRYLLVTVKNSPGRTCTSLHATVTLHIGRKRMVRRVGSRGAQAGGGSYIDTVHFGLGRVAKVPRVLVRWACGLSRQRFQVAANQKISIGKP